jgi:hypothetical protein
MLTLIFGILLATSARADCPSTQNLTAKSMNPEGIRAWLKGHSDSLKTVEDLVCCLPQSFLKNYLVSYAGRAGQNGSPESPRVFLYDSTKTDTLMLTFNGGDAYLNQPLNVEVGYLKDNKFDVYDIEFYKRFASMSERNPARCLRCHGETTTRELTANEARPFFHMNASSSFVGGTATCSPEEDDLQNKVQTMALDQIVKNSRFNCLDRALAQTTLANKEKTPFRNGPFAEKLKRFKSILSKYQKTRLAKLIHDSPKYSSYKFAILGSQMCPGLKPEEWLPPKIGFENMTAVNSEIANASTSDEFARALNHLQDERDSHIRSIKRIANSEFELQRGTFRPSFQSWLCPSDPSFAKLQPVDVPPDLTPLAKTAFRYELDTKAKIFPPSDMTHATATMRLLFEGRGVDTTGWSLAFSPKDDLQPFESVVAELLSGEPKNNRDWTCEKLKRASLQALAADSRSALSH